ncbi:cyclase family protein [Rhodococcus chondri]|uniref:Cyclase family protein n=1 Tax=Rhodococcus chondri TaxID=3065941 RepID=A0ABU7JKM8_9NOCA|nr:cyclase family protein [Rhodococcus sp. CC-R104]MEE2030596.1 cyclase family protein [Rhodococcus sp. CC-R104]
MRVVRIVDLSHPISTRTQVYPGDPVPVFTPHARIADDGYNLLRIDLGTQTGTHIDAPRHIRDDGAPVDRLPPGMLVGRGVILDVRGRVAPRGHITPELWGEADLRPGDLALVHTGWSQYFGTDAYFDHPALSVEACRWLIERGVRTIGIDAPSIDPTGDEALAAHRVIAAAHGVICENLRNLEAIDFADPLVSLLPIAFEGADGAPVRAVAMQIEA